MDMGGDLGPKGRLGLAVVGNSRPSIEELSAKDLLRLAAGEVSLGRVPAGEASAWKAWKRHNFDNEFMRRWQKIAQARKLDIPHFWGALWLEHWRKDGPPLDLGLVSCGVITTAGVNYLVADMGGGASDINLFKFHALGTGTNAEASGDTALQTELTTQYQTDNTRPTGSQTTGGSANIYRTVGTITVDASVAATEHGILTQAATGGGTLWDRSVFSVVNLASGESIQATYDATFNAGG